MDSWLAAVFRNFMGIATEGYQGDDPCAYPHCARALTIYMELELLSTWSWNSSNPDTAMVYVLAILIPPLGLLLNGQPFAALLNVGLIIPCFLLGLIFHVLWLVPSLHAVISVYMRREQRRHREIVEAIERHGPPPGPGY
jgi:uncharacterized membrane protein YqaE (UPF0057 family)